MTIFDRIRIAREQKGMSQEALALKLGYKGRSAISKIETGENDINHTSLLKFAEILDVSTAWLLHGDELAEKLHPITIKRFRVLGQIACGEPIFSEEDKESYIDAKSDIDADFCLIATGESMTGARINDGDVVFIKQMPIVQNGEIAAVGIGDEFTLKYWYYYPDKNKLILNPANPAYEPLIYTGDELNDIHCLGKAVCFMSNL